MAGVIRICNNSTNLNRVVCALSRKNLCYKYVTCAASPVFFKSNNSSFTSKFHFSRNLLLERTLDKTDISRAPSSLLEKHLYNADREIRRVGRISKEVVDELHNFLKTSGTASSTQVLLLLRCCGSLIAEELPEVRNKLIQSIWKTLDELKIPLDISHYNALLRVYLENEYQFSPSEFLAQLEKQNIEPNRVTYQRLIAKYCQDGDINGATKILEYMKEKQLPINESVFHSLIQGHGRSNDIESACGILEIMNDSGLEPVTETYLTLMLAYAEQGDLDGIKSVIEKSNAADVTIYDRDYMEIIFTLCKYGHAQYISEIIGYFKKMTGFNQDIISLIYRIINIGYDDIAYQLFQTMPPPLGADGDIGPSGGFLIRHMTKAQRPVSKIVEICDKMKSSGINYFALEKAIESSYLANNPSLALSLIRILNEQQSPVRTHYFWPMFLQCKLTNKKENIYEVVEAVQKLNVNMTLETLSQYLIPSLISCNEEPDSIISDLKSIGVSASSSVTGLVAYYLECNDLETAANILSKYRIRLTHLLRRELVDAFVTAGNPNATAAILGQMCLVDFQGENVLAEKKDAEFAADDISGKTVDVAGLSLIDVAYSLRHNNKEKLFLPLLKAVEQKGLTIGQDAHERILQVFEEHLTEEITSILHVLASGKLTFQPLQRPAPTPLTQLSLQELERRLADYESRDLPVQAILGQILVTSARQRDNENAENYMQKMKSLQIPIGEGQYALVVDMYVSIGQLASAEKSLQEMELAFPDIKLSKAKTVKLAQLYVSDGRIDDAIDLFRKHAYIEDQDEADTTNYSVSCWRVLNAAAEKGDSEAVAKLQTAMIELKYTHPNTGFMGPLIKSYLVKDDLNGALKAFQDICNNYKITPWKQELTCRFINQEDTESLQKIMDLSTVVHGEMNSLYDLVFSFIECGKVRQARKILETPGLRAQHGRLNHICQKYLNEGMTTELENLVAVTKDLFNIDRHSLYSGLLQAYKNEGNVDKALGLWTKMQEENLEPRDSFLFDLGTFLKKSGHDVPFVMPEASVTENSSGEQLQIEFRKALSSRNVSAALNIKRQVDISGEKFPVRDQSLLIEALIKNGQSNEAVRMTEDMLKNCVFPMPHVFSFLLNNLAKAGDTETFKTFKSYLNEDIKKLTSFDNRECNAHLAAGTADVYLQNLLNDIKSRSAIRDGSAIAIPRGGLLGVLEVHPNHINLVSEVANALKEQNIYSGYSCIWAHHVKREEYDKAHQIYENHLKGAEEPLLIVNICQFAKKLENDKILEYVGGIVKQHSNVANTAFISLYSTWIDVLCNKRNYDDGLKVLEAALEHLTLRDLPQKTLIGLKWGLETSGKVFPFSL